MDFDEMADELYSVSPEDFTARRTELAAIAREAGDRDLARAVTGLRRPSLAAWLVNQLVRQQPGELIALVELGHQLREAHRSLAGDRLRELSAERGRLVRSAIEAARSQAGRTISEDVVRQLQETLEAAVADEGAEAAVESGRLTNSLSYSGFGEVDLTDAIAGGSGRPRLRLVRDPLPRPAATEASEADAEADAAARKAAKAREEQRTRAEAAFRKADDDAAAARYAARGAEAELRELQQRERSTDAEITRLQQELAGAREALHTLHRRISKAAQDVETMQRRQERADERLAAARSALDDTTA
jgi:DNA repair exonuclease SbcCD ATPase subunit